MHEVQFTLTGDNLPALEHAADAKAADYLGDQFEPMLTGSKAVPNFNPTNRVALPGWRVTFRYRGRPIPTPIRPRRTVRAVANTEPEQPVEPYGDGHPIEGAA